MEDYEKRALEDFFDKLPDGSIEQLSQTAKADSGKIEMAYVPPAIIEAVGKIRTYGNAKYGNPENWREVEPIRYKHALMRHLVEWLEDEDSIDEESGLLHSEHMACNLAFLLSFQYDRLKGVQE